MAEMTNIPEPSGMKPEAETPASEPKAPVNERTTKKEDRPVSPNGKNAARPNEKRPASEPHFPYASALGSDVRWCGRTFLSL